MELARGRESEGCDPSVLGVAFFLFRIAMLCQRCPQIPFQIQLLAPGFPRGMFVSLADGIFCAHDE